MLPAIKFEHIQPIVRPAGIPVDRPSFPANDFRARVLKEYLVLKGFDGLPRDPRELSDFKTFLEAKGYAPNTVNFCLSPVRMAYRVIGIETAKIIKGPKRSTNHLKDAVPEAETSALLRYADEHCTPRDRFIMYLMAYLGLREVEISRLDMGDIWMQNGKWKVRLWGKGRSGKEDVMTITNGLIDVFLEYREIVLSDRKIGQPMFIGKKGCRLRPDVLSRIAREIMRKAGVKREDNDHRITPHSLRHTAVTKVLTATKDIRKAQKFARHLDVRTTEVYAHDIEGNGEESINW